MSGSRATWHGDPPPAAKRIGPAGWIRVVVRGCLLLAVIYGGTAVFLVLRAIEALLGGRRRWSPDAVRAVSRLSVAVLGLRYRVQGMPAQGIGAQVANHASWLDIFVLNACQRVWFVSKAEVAGWPVIGFLARMTGTLFIRRDPKEARAQQAALEERLRAGQRLVFFPEGTSSNGIQVLPFKSTLFQAFFAEDLKPDMWVQPVTIRYSAPPGEDPRFYAWWGNMGFGPHLLRLLACAGRGAVDVIFGDPIALRDQVSRKDVSAETESAVRAAFAASR